jgi:hypothetical protein
MVEFVTPAFRSSTQSPQWIDGASKFEVPDEVQGNFFDSRDECIARWFTFSSGKTICERLDGPCTHMTGQSIWCVGKCTVWACANVSGLCARH